MVLMGMNVPNLTAIENKERPFLVQQKENQ